MPDRCTIIDCSRSSRLFCKCCREEFCLPHFSEHHDRVNVQFNQLKSDLHAVNEQLRKHQIERFLNQFRQQMKQWRIESYTTVDQFYDEKCREFIQYVDQQLSHQPDEIRQIQNQIETLDQMENVQQDQLDSFQRRLGDVKEKINQIEQTLASMVLTPLKIDSDVVRIPK